MNQREEQYHEVKVHMDGIETMVKMRGGLITIGLNHFLTHMILWQAPHPHPQTYPSPQPVLTFSSI